MFQSTYFQNRNRFPFNEDLNYTSSEAIGFRIWMAGDVEQAKQVLRSICSIMGACYSITETHYVYSGGEESGFIIDIFNYPRFPKSASDLLEETEAVAYELMMHLNQGSFTIQDISTGQTNGFYSRRKSD